MHGTTVAKKWKKQKMVQNKQIHTTKTIQKYLYTVEKKLLQNQNYYNQKKNFILESMYI